MISLYVISLILCLMILASIVLNRMKDVLPSPLEVGLMIFISLCPGLNSVVAALGIIVTIWLVFVNPNSST